MKTTEKSVWVQFKTHYVTQSEDFVLAITGSLPDLGQWNVTRAVVAGKLPYDTDMTSKSPLTQNDVPLSRIFITFYAITSIE